MSSNPARVIGRYLLCDPIASGGMATVHLGRLMGPIGFAKTVAIKRLRDDLAVEPGGIARFLDEARLTARVQHPNVVSTLDALSFDGELFLVMEFVKGAPLSLLWRNAHSENRRIPTAVSVGIVLGALHGLHAAHEAKGDDGKNLGIIHRDVSPQNIMVGEEGVPRLLDFGVAKATWRLQTTEQGSLKGKISYMSPEQLEGSPSDRRADIYSMGIVLWELLTGERLYPMDALGSTITTILESTPKAPSELCPELPKALDDVVLRALAKRADERFPTAQEFALALENAHPAASQRVIGELVKEVARDYLAKQDNELARAATAGISELETSPGRVSSPDAAELPTQRHTPSGSRNLPGRVVSDSARTADAIVRSQRPDRTAQSRVVLVTAAVGVVVLVGGIWAITSHRASPKLENGTASGVLVAPRLAASPATPLETAPSSVPEPSSPPTASVSASPATSADAGLKPVHRKEKPASNLKPRKPNCNPPYVIDENGVKRYLPECF